MPKLMTSSLLPRNVGLILLLGGLSATCDSDRKPQPVDETPVVAAAETAYSPEILDIAKRLGISADHVQRVRSLPQDELNRMAEASIEQNHTNGVYFELLPAADLVAPLVITTLTRPNAFVQRPGTSNHLRSF